MEEKKKSYMIEMGMEVITEDGETVKDIRICGMKNPPIPLGLWCDFLRRLTRMTPDGKMELTVGEERPLVEKDMGYIITENYDGFITGDIFRGVSECELEHGRSGKVIRVDREMMDTLFRGCGIFDTAWTKPVSDETLEMIRDLKEVSL